MIDGYRIAVNLPICRRDLLSFHHLMLSIVSRTGFSLFTNMGGNVANDCVFGFGSEIAGSVIIGPAETISGVSFLVLPGSAAGFFAMAFVTGGNFSGVGFGRLLRGGSRFFRYILNNVAPGECIPGP
jgi:hypothetical protein